MKKKEKRVTLVVALRASEGVARRRNANEIMLEIVLEVHEREGILSSSASSEVLDNRARASRSSLLKL